MKINRLTRFISFWPFVVMIVLVSMSTEITAAQETTTCTGQDVVTANATVPKVKQALDHAIAAIDTGSNGDRKKLEHWLGATTPDQIKSVRATLVKARVFANGVSFLCAVNTSIALGDIYARVNAGTPFTVVLAAFFFSAPDTGFDSKLGVIVHEFTHFILVGATKDKAYGTTAAVALAASNPDQALQNADNYEYFVESVEFGLT